MLEISTGKIAYLAILAREIDVKVAPWDNVSDDRDSDAGSVLETMPDDPEIAEFRSFVDGLNEDEQASLVAVMWIGRETFDPTDIQEAIATAKTERLKAVADYLLGIPLLPDYLEAGLNALGIDPEEAEEEFY